MVTLRVFRGEALLGELDVRGGAAEVGDREGDAVRLDDLGIAAPPGVGGRIEQRGGAWVFVPRSGNEAGRELPLRDGDRLSLGDGAVEVAIRESVPVVDLASIPHDEGIPIPFSAAPPRPGTAAARLAMLADFLRRLEDGTTSDEVLAGALDGAFRLVGAERGIVAMLEADGKGLRVVASRNLAGEDPRRALSRRVLDAVLGQGRDVFTGNAPVDIPTVSVNLRSIRAICALPLRVRGTVCGVLYVDRGVTSSPFAEEDLAFLRLLSGLVARRLEEDERLRRTESERRLLADRLARREADEEEDLGWTSPAMRRVRGEAERLLKAFQGRSLPVLITGESGTGKEVLARWLHAHLDGGKGPFVAVNCAAIPHDLTESELFGIEQGVASGVLRRLGRFQQASGGTLFLDEIGEMSAAVQSKVLRAVESRRIVRVGGREEIPVDLRIVSATNRDLQAATREGGSARTSTGGCAASKSACPRSVSGGRTSPSSAGCSPGSSRRSSVWRRRPWSGTRWRASWPTTGRETCANCARGSEP